MVVSGCHSAIAPILWLVLSSWCSLPSVSASRGAGLVRLLVFLGASSLLVLVAIGYGPCPLFGPYRAGFALFFVDLPWSLFWSGDRFIPLCGFLHSSFTFFPMLWEFFLFLG